MIVADLWSNRGESMACEEGLAGGILIVYLCDISICLGPVCLCMYVYRAYSMVCMSCLFRIPSWKLILRHGWRWSPATEVWSSAHCMCQWKILTRSSAVAVIVKVSLKLNDIALRDKSSQSYKASLAIWDHTVLSVTRHKWTHPALNPARQAGTQFTYRGGMEGWVDSQLNGAISTLMKSKMASSGHFEKKIQMVISLKCIIRFTLRMVTDHTLPSDSIMTVDAYDRRLVTYFAREGN